MSSFWKGVMDGILFVSMTMMFLAVIFLCAWMYPPLHEAKKADCALVEFSPDYSAEIKQLCREARRNK
jgi:hypothetical protein